MCVSALPPPVAVILIGQNHFGGISRQCRMFWHLWKIIFLAKCKTIEKQQVNQQKYPHTHMRALLSRHMFVWQWGSNRKRENYSRSRSHLHKTRRSFCWGTTTSSAYALIL